MSKLKKALIFVMLFGCFFTASDLSAVVRKKKIPLAPEPVNISEAFYDKAWRDYQVGTPKEKAEVVKSLRAVLRKAPEEFMAHYYLGIMISETGSPAQALRHFETALLGFPKSADIHVRMADLLLDRNKVDDAVEHYQKALEIEPGNGRALAQLGMYELEQGNSKEARKLLSEAKDRQPDNPDVLRAYGAVLLELEYAGEAAEVLDQALLFDQKHAETHWLLAKACEQLHQAEKAAKHFELAKQYGRRDAELKEIIGYDLARSLEKSGKVDEAIAEYQKEIRKNADPATGHYELGRLYEDLAREDDAIKSYLQAYNLDRGMAEGIMRAADIYRQREDYDNAENFYSMLRRDSKYGEQARDEIKEIEQNRQQLETRKIERKLMESGTKDSEVEEAYYELLDRDKNNVDALEGLQRFYEERGYYDQALSVYRRLCKAKGVSSAGRKRTETELKEKFSSDNLALFGKSGASDYKSSSVSSDELFGMVNYGKNDRQRETAMQILLTRKEHQKDRRLIEKLMDFYEERGNIKEALKCVTKLKRHGYYNDYEAKAKRAQLRGK